MKRWTIEDSKELYNINGWGTSYFGVNDEGNVFVTPCKNEVQIDLREVMDELSLRDVQSPVLLRFPDILDNELCGLSHQGESDAASGRGDHLSWTEVQPRTGSWFQA